MPLDTEVVGCTTEPISHPVDARWIMSYAAGLGDTNPRYLDTDTQKVRAHPMFPVCPEWPAVLACRALPGYDALSDEEAARGVHAAHDLQILRPIADGDRLSTTATVTSVQAIRPGAALVSRLDTVDQQDELVARSYQLSILRGVDIVGEPQTSEAMPDAPKLEVPWAESRHFAIPIAAGAAHVYTECARIWNPVHTDRAVALAAGLPDIILHGTAAMALAVSRLIDEFLGGDPRRVRRIGGRFSAMVLMPSTLSLEVRGRERGTLFFTVLTEDGQSAFGGGFLGYE